MNDCPGLHKAGINTNNHNDGRMYFTEFFLSVRQCATQTTSILSSSLGDCLWFSTSQMKKLGEKMLINWSSTKHFLSNRGKTTSDLLLSYQQHLFFLKLIEHLISSATQSIFDKYLPCRLLTFRTKYKSNSQSEIRTIAYEQTMWMQTSRPW